MITCSECGTSTEAKRLPPGWKRLHDVVRCKACWRDRYVLRAVTIPVASPVDCDWKELQAALDLAWAGSTELSNWLVRELLRRDVDVDRRKEEKMPRMPRVYLYPEASKVFPEIPSRTRSSIEQQVQARYRKRRYDLLWRRAQNPPWHRYPTPYPVHNQAWSASIGDGGELLVSVELPGGRKTLRLRGGARFRRQRGAVQKIIRGEALAGELSIYRAAASSGDHRKTIEGRGPGGAPRRPSSVMVKMVAWLPREKTKPKDRVALIRSGLSEFLVVDVEERERAWVLNADHVRRWIWQHRARIQRLSDDVKAERRPRRERRGLDAHRDMICRKQRNRLKSFQQETASHLVRFLNRYRCGAAVIDLSEQDYFASFPWFEFEEYLREKMNEHGITVIETKDMPVQALSG